MPPAQAAITKTDWTEAQVRVRQLEVSTLYGVCNETLLAIEFF